MVDYQIFVNNLGVLQGEIISPLPFSLYVNDCEMEFLTDKNTPIHYKRSLYFFTNIRRRHGYFFSVCLYDLQSILNTPENVFKKWGNFTNRRCVKKLK